MKYQQLVVLALELVLPLHLVNAQWVQTSGPYADTGWRQTGLRTGHVNALVLDKSGNLFAVTAGVRVSTDEGVTWVRVDPSSLQWAVRSIAITPTVGATKIFAGTYHGVYLWTNTGIGWTQAGLDSQVVIALAVSAAGSDPFVFAGTDAGVYRSSDDGRSWSAANTGLTERNIQILVVSPRNNDMGIATLFAGTYRGLFRSSDNGATWSLTNLPNIQVSALVFDSSGILYAGTSLLYGGGGVYISEDEGESWTFLGKGPGNSNIKSLAISPYSTEGRYVVAGTSAGLFVGKIDTSSECRPIKWIPFTSGFPSSAVVALALSIDVDASKIYAGTNGAGVWSRPLSDILDVYPLSRRGIITGQIFNDENHNGLKDPTEIPLIGRIVHLFGKSQDSMVTDCNGEFIFSGLDSGTYSLTESIPYPWIVTSPLAQEYSCIRSVNDSSGYFLFGNYFPHGAIKGKVYSDKNHNGFFDAGDKRLGGWNIGLSGRGQASVQTDSNGEFTFVNLPPGTFTLHESIHLPWVYSSPESGSYTTTLALDDTSFNLDFGNLYPWCSMTGTVFWDLNENGSRDTLEPPLNNWLVRLFGDSRDSALTDSLGQYSFKVDRGLHVAIPSLQEPWEIIPANRQGGDSVQFTDYDKHVQHIDFPLHHIPKRVRLTLRVHDSNMSPWRDIVLGVRAGATGGIWGADYRSTVIDFSEGESEIPPRDFAAFYGLFDARLVYPGYGSGNFGEGSWTDMRNYDSTEQTNAYRIAVLPGRQTGGNYPITLRWSRDSIIALYHGPVTIDDEHGTIVDMKSDDVLIVQDSTIEFLNLLTSGPNLVSVHINNFSLLPVEYKLEQNYPNPFNPVTNLEYELPAQSKVKLSVYNILGEIVAVLVDGIEDPGRKSKEWNAISMPSGVYFYRLEATSTSKIGESFTQVRKMLLVK